MPHRFDDIGLTDFAHSESAQCLDQTLGRRPIVGGESVVVEVAARPRGSRGITHGALPAGDVQRLRQREGLCIECLSDDRAFHAVAHEFAQIGDVIEAGHATRGDDGLVRAVGNLAKEREVRTLQCPVLCDVGEHVSRTPGFVEAVEHLPEVTALFRPAAGGERRAADVKADGDRLAILGDDVSSPLGVLERRRSQVDPLRTGCKSRIKALDRKSVV